MESLEGKMIKETSLSTTESIIDSTEITTTITQPSPKPDDESTEPEFHFRSKFLPRFAVRLRRTRRWPVPTLMRPWMKTPRWFKWCKKWPKITTVAKFSKISNEQNNISSTLQTTTTISSTTLAHTKCKTSLSSGTKKSESTIGQTITNILLSTESKTSLKVTDDIEDEQEPYDYDISFHNVTIKLISGTPYPKHIQCEFFKNLKVSPTRHTSKYIKLRLKFFVCSRLIIK